MLTCPWGLLSPGNQGTGRARVSPLQIWFGYVSCSLAMEATKPQEPQRRDAIIKKYEQVQARLLARGGGRAPHSQHMILWEWGRLGPSCVIAPSPSCSWPLIQGSSWFQGRQRWAELECSEEEDKSSFFPDRLGILQ